MRRLPTGRAGSPATASIVSRAPSSLCSSSRANDARLPGSVSMRPGNSVDASVMRLDCRLTRHGSRKSRV